MNIPEFLEESEPFYKFNREERNVAAILYHLLLTDRNLATFAELAKAPIDATRETVEVYYEFAYLRDLWYRHRDDEKRRELILRSLRREGTAFLETCSKEEFNLFFGAKPVSTSYIQSPGRWVVTRLAKRVTKPKDLLRACRFKWAFNIKPDLVVIDLNLRAICVECKLASGEGSYPTAAAEKELFAELKLPRVRQTELQQFLMQKLLGMATTFVYLTRDEGSDGIGEESDSDVPVTRLSWKQTFEALPHATCPPFIREWIDSLRHGVSTRRDAGGTHRSVWLRRSEPR